MLKAIGSSPIAFGFLRAWCNGSIRVSKTFDLGSNPSARAMTIVYCLDRLTLTVVLNTNGFRYSSNFKP